jgi:hypothetical protein
VREINRSFDPVLRKRREMPLNMTICFEKGISGTRIQLVTEVYSRRISQY